MAFCLVVGSQEFSKAMDEYRGQQHQCRNCGNISAVVLKRWKWFTVCWIPLLPLSGGWKQDVVCPVCRFWEPLEKRPDVTSGQSVQGHPQQNHAMHGGGYGGSPVGSPQQQGAMGGGYGGSQVGSPQQQGAMGGGYGGGPPQQQPQYK